MIDNLSFHSVRPLDHKQLVKVLILPLALLAAVAGNTTAQTMFKVLSFFWVDVSVRTNTIYTARHYRHYQYLRCPEIHKELPVRLTGQDQQLDLVLDFSKTPGHC